MRKLAIVLLFLVSCGKQEDKPTTAIERAKDPVCGMWVSKTSHHSLVWDNAKWSFCAKDCLISFRQEPTKYAKACECKKINANCKCDHCAGKLEPCDCRN